MQVKNECDNAWWAVTRLVGFKSRQSLNKSKTESGIQSHDSFVTLSSDNLGDTLFCFCSISSLSEAPFDCFNFFSGFPTDSFDFSEDRSLQHNCFKSRGKIEGSQIISFPTSKKKVDETKLSSKLQQNTIH